MFDLLNSLLRSVNDAGQEKAAYFFFQGLSVAIALGVALFYFRKMNMPQWKAVPLVLVSASGCYMFMLLLNWAQSGFREFGGQNNSTVFVYYPLIYWLPAKILKVNFKKLSILLAVGAPLIQAIGHIGCIFTGCCSGYPASWGIYNEAKNINGVYLFPNQLLESLVAFAITFFFMWKDRKSGYAPTYKHYPMMLIMFGSTRFLLEFLRDERKLLFGLSSVNFHMLFAIAVGIVWLVVLNRKEKARTATEVATN